MFHLEGPMSFGSSRDIARTLLSSKDQEVLIIDLSDVPFIDSSASIALEEVIQDARTDNDYIILCGIREKVDEVLAKIGVIQLVPSDCNVRTRLEALRKADSLLGKSG